MSTVENPHAGQGMVVLDIGGDIGALVVLTPATMAGLEIEICPAGARRDAPDEGGDWWLGDWRGHSHRPDNGGHAHAHPHQPAWPHVAVLARPAAGPAACSAVFPGLRAGRYDLWPRTDGATGMSVSVIGGQVTTAPWAPSAGE